jgi:predicted DCC family thiol-disulfide oxidoreductase YuxK
MQGDSQIILFDGICNLCNGTVDFLLKHDGKKQFRFVSLQSNEGKELTAVHQIPDETDSVIFIKSGKTFIESEAVIEISALLNYPWKLGKFAKILPKKIRDKIYRIIAKNRFRWFGKRETCRIIP